MEDYKQKILKSFNKRAKKYDEYSIIQREVADRLIDRIKMIKINPKKILDIGSGTGYLSNKLKIIFPQSEIICLDLSSQMLNISKKKYPNLLHLVADAEDLPFKDSSFDFVLSSFTFHWCKDIDKLLSTIIKILNEKGLLIFTTVGPDTLIELNNIFKEIDNEQHVNDFLDMHIYGDMLLSQGYEDPVVDVEKIKLEYPNLNTAINSLRETGSNVLLKDKTRKSNMKIKEKYRKFYKNNDYKDIFPITYELIYATAWKKNKIKNPESDKIIPIKEI
ncbi:MAG: malonyl-[acyl-carrier protein] O-methyltransferase BioC [Gammaproteobacteria bacterium]|mgnify:CR=1 FL=1|nr:malonyl-[acyl-carrier protein] O-methyltransferase BioC [Gammaproteobacteria bacterium]|tara:strand:+ start:104053 stop:104880 length:828 start_codon:yes stop_codon:yes gene_type:complete